MGQFFQVSGDQSSCLPGSGSLFGITVSSPVCVHLLAKMDSSTEAYGKVDTSYSGVAPSPFWTPRKSFCILVVGEVSLISRMRSM